MLDCGGAKFSVQHHPRRTNKANKEHAAYTPGPFIKAMLNQGI